MVVFSVSLCIYMIVLSGSLMSTIPAPDAALYFIAGHVATSFRHAEVASASTGAMSYLLA